MAVLTAAGVVMSAAGLVIAVDQAPAASSGDRSALYASVTAVLVALIGGTVAIVTSRRTPVPVADPSPVRYLDAPTSNALPAAMAELYEHVKEQLDVRTAERDEWKRVADVWQHRARALGWADEDTG